jgi:hypothetical protein
MTKYLRLASGVLYLGVLALGVVYFDPACPLTHSPRWDSGTRASMAEEVARNEQLKQFREASFPRAEDKWQRAEEVIARRQGLAEDIEQFRELDRPWPDLRAGIKRPELVWMSEDEWDGRMVIDQVRLDLADRPDEAAAVADRLEKELQQLLAQRKKRPPAPTAPRAERSR